MTVNMRLWRQLDAARDAEAWAALRWAEAVGPGYAEADAWQTAVQAVDEAQRAFEAQADEPLMLAA